MDKKIKTKWLKALRSGKYKQGRGTLKDGDKYCCLGVLADICDKRIVRGNNYLGKRFLSAIDLSHAMQARLAAKNDNRWSFNRLAKYIEEIL